jgi:hypothetical protein
MTNTDELNITPGTYQIINTEIIASDGATVAECKFPSTKVLNKPIQSFNPLEIPLSPYCQTITLPSLELETKDEMQIPLYVTSPSVYAATEQGGNYKSTSSLFDDFIFSSATNGEDTLELKSTLSSAELSTLMGYYIESSGSTYSDYSTVSSSSIQTVGTDRNTSELKSNNDHILPQYVLTSTIPSGCQFGKFSILAGSTLPSDSTCIYVSNDKAGQPVIFSEMTHLTDNSGFLLSDYLIDSSEISFVEHFTSSGISIPPNTRIPEGLSLKFLPIVRNVGVSKALVDPESISAGDIYLLYNYGMLPKFTLSLPKGFKVQNNFRLPKGTTWVSGYTLQQGTSFSEVCDLSDAIPIRRCVISPGFILSDGDLLNNALPGINRSVLTKGMSTSNATEFLAGSYTNDDLDLQHGVMFASNKRTPSDLTVKSDSNLRDNIILSSGSLIKKGTILPQGSESLEGSVVEQQLVFNSGSRLTQGYETNSQFNIDQGSTLQVGTILKSPILPVGITLPVNTSLPTELKISPPSNYPIGADSELPVGILLGPGFTMKGQIGLKPDGEIPAGTSITGTFTLPAGTKLPAGSVFPSNDIPMPTGTVFPKLSTLPKDTVFTSGSEIKTDLNLESHIPTATQILNQTESPLAIVYNLLNEKFLRYSAGTVFLSGFKFPKGTVISTRVQSGTFSYEDSVAGVDGQHNTNCTLTLDPTEYSYTSKVDSTGGETLVITAGDKTTSDLYLKAEFPSPRDILVPYNGDKKAARNILIPSDFVLKQDVKTSENLEIGDSIKISWPRRTPLAADFTLSEDVDIGSNSTTQIIKPITLNVDTTDSYIFSIFTPFSLISFPQQPYRLTKSIKNSSEALCVGTLQNHYSTGSYMKLPIGYRIQSPVTLSEQLQITGEFIIFSAIQNVPSFVSTLGIKLPKNSVFPGTVTLQPRVPLPKGITLPSTVTLASDYIVTSDKSSETSSSYTLLKGTLLKNESVISEDSSFPRGITFNIPVSFKDITSIQSNTTFTMFAGEQLSTDVLYYQIYGESQQGFDSSKATEDLQVLKDLVASLQQQVYNLTR